MASCTASECDEPAQARDFCRGHYNRYLRYGDPNHYPRGRTAEERMQVRGWTVTDSGCWEWKGHRLAKGYGHMKIGGRAVVVSRLAYELWVGPIPEGHVVRHKCDNPPCINPEHLETGTVSENNSDRDVRGRHGTAVLNPESVRSIREEYNQGSFRLRALGTKYGVDPETIRDVVQNRTWRWVV